MPSLRRLVRDASGLLPRDARSTVSVVENVVNHVKEVPSRVAKRQSSATTSSSSSAATCTTTECKHKSTATTITMPVVLAVVIPLLMAIVVFVFLHRRHVRKLRAEDANDKHKSLDFGMDEVTPNSKKSRKEKVPEMSLQETQNELRRTRGLSLDMATPNPYLLPPGLQTSRESIHSMSRSLNDDGDPYRPVTIMFTNDGPNGSYPASLRQRDDSSSYTGSSKRGFPINESSQNLLNGAQRMSRSFPSTQRNSFGTGNHGHIPPQLQSAGPRRISPGPHDGLSPIGSPMSPLIDMSSPTIPERAASPFSPTQRSSPPVALSINPQSGLPGNPTLNARDAETLNPAATPPPPVSPFASDEDELADKEPQLPQIHTDDGHDFDSNFRVDPPSPERHGEGNHNRNSSHYEQDFGYDVRRLTMGIRPLPPDDPSENPEQRANRIRSFYKEYFDETTPGPKFQQDDYYDEYAPDFAAYDTPIYDPDSGNFITGNTPYAEPITRRAMTPPPRGPPRFRGNVTSSGSESVLGGRAMTSASGRMPPPRQPKKKLPPPKPLAILPTPHMLKDDTIVPIDFAPPQSITERVHGVTPQSPKGGFRPYSPSLKPSKMLVSSFDDLAIMPSPHALRRSGTFTALDFAPPPRFKNAETSSDAGSIRSNRSGLSAVHSNAIRSGAYRLSRVPKEQVGTRDDFAVSLKPSWDMRH